MISTNFITGTGFIKCIPITLSGREVTAAILVIEMEEVFVDKIAPSGAYLSMSLNIFNFKSTFSVAASTTKSAFFTPASRLVNAVILLSVEVLSASVIFSFLTIRSRFFVMVAMALSKESCATSTNDTE